ncbi:MAG: hypothetical protein V3T52_04340 [Thermodesulfobacteriota bacterium]
MPKFLVIHPIDPPLSRETLTPFAIKLKAALSTDAYWVSSYLQLNDKGEVTKVFSDWDAKDAESIRKTCANSIPDFPASESILPVAIIHGEKYR